MASSSSHSDAGVRLRAEALSSYGYAAWRSQTLNRMARHRADSGAFSAELALVRADEVLVQNLPLGLATADHHLVTLHDVSASPRIDAVAWLWLRVRDEEQGRVAFAFDVHVRADRAADCGVQVMGTTERLARLLGAEVLWHNVFSTDAGLVLMLDGRGYAVSASRLRLSLDEASSPSVPAGFELRPMTPEQFASWFDGQEESYAAQLVEAGRKGPRSRARAAADMAGLLPDGLTTANQLLLTADADGQEVGSLWASVQPGVDGEEVWHAIKARPVAATGTSPAGWRLHSISCAR